MSGPRRLCADCGADISERHHSAKYCWECAGRRYPPTARQLERERRMDAALERGAERDSRPEWWSDLDRDWERDAEGEQALEVEWRRDSSPKMPPAVRRRGASG